MNHSAMVASDNRLHNLNKNKLDRYRNKMK
jgi:hypothetical protein